MPKDIKLLVIIGGVIGFIVVTFLIALFLNPTSTPAPTPFPSSSPLSSVFYGVDRSIIINPNYTQPSITPYTPQNDYSQEYVQRATEIEKADQPQIRQDQAVGSLLSLLPYKGSYFSMVFDFTTADFVVELNKSHLGEANQEFENFLLKNGVQSRSWIKNLVIKEL